MRARRFAVVLAVLATGCGGDESSDSGSPPSGGELASSNGCLACHRVGDEGNAEPGSDLSTVGARRSTAEIRSALTQPPAGMPSYEGRLSAGEVDALTTYLAGLR
jgi:mono/diheme cytochrome c family protein